MLDATITISLPPSFHVGPMTLAWHGLMIAIGILAGGWLALRYGKERQLEPDRLQLAILILAVAGMIGARFYYLVQSDASALIRPGEWLGQNGYAFYGAIIVGLPAVALYLWRKERPLSYVDSLAAGFPLGMAVGRIGDLINGEHYGPPTNAPWGFHYTNPGAAVPSSHLAYQSGAFYEILLALLMLAVFWPLRDRIRPPGLLLCLTVAVYAAGRFLIFFVIRDTNVVALGLRQAQLTSLALLALAGLGAWCFARQARRSPDPGEHQPASAGAASP